VEGTAGGLGCGGEEGGEVEYDILQRLSSESNVSARLFLSLISVSLICKQIGIERMKAQELQEQEGTKDERKRERGTGTKERQKGREEVETR
jgi:hypothetical protein